VTLAGQRVGNETAYLNIIFDQHDVGHQMRVSRRAAGICLLDETLRLH
jgi:hypothetical protein